jgi:hypothetical protein
MTGEVPKLTRRQGQLLDEGGRDRAGRPARVGLHSSGRGAP